MGRSATVALRGTVAYSLGTKLGIKWNHPGVRICHLQRFMHARGYLLCDVAVRTATVSSETPLSHR